MDALLVSSECFYLSVNQSTSHPQGWGVLSEELSISVLSTYKNPHPIFPKLCDVPFSNYDLTKPYIRQYTLYMIKSAKKNITHWALWTVDL